MAAAKRFRSVPIAFLDSERLLVATADPANVLALDDIAMSTGYDVRLAVASPEDIEALVGQRPGPLERRYCIPAAAGEYQDRAVVQGSGRERRA